MAYRIADSVAETTTSVGAGDLVLSGALTGHIRFNAVPNIAVGDKFPGRIQAVDASGNATGDWETGIYTYSATDTISRTKITGSSNGGSVVTFGSGTKQVMLAANSVAIGVNEILDPSGTVFQLMADTGRHPVSYWSPTNNSTTVPTVQGIAAFTAVGTATARAVAATNAATMIRRLGYVTAATAGALASHYQATAILWPGDGTNRTSGFRYSLQFVPSDAATVSGARMFVGIGQSVSAPTNVEPNTLTNTIAVAQLSTDSTQLYLVYGGSTAQTAIALGATSFPAGTLSTSAFEIAIYSPWDQASTYYVQIRNLGTGATKTFVLSGAATVVPQAGTALAPRASRTNNATALAVGLDVGTYLLQMGI